MLALILRFCKRTFRYLFLLAPTFSVTGEGRAQEAASPLYAVLRAQDSLLFDVGFNTCNIAQFEKSISDDFEFYHDEAGITSSKEAFIKTIEKNLCSSERKASRQLVEGSVKVYPLKQGGVLYGAIQTGVHRFYIGEQDKINEQGNAREFTGRAQFTHIWKLTNGEWKLLRGLSYDHTTTDTTHAIDETILAIDLNDAGRVNAWLKAHKVPGLAIGIVRENTLREIKVFGELEAGKPMPNDAVFNIASITKSIVAYLTLRLISNGEWDLDEPLHRYWIDPDVQSDPRHTQLTTRHILTHRSGFPNWRWQLPGKKLAFQSDPGTTYQYSGEGYEYLRRALEAKFKQPLDRLAHKLVFQPLGMKDTRFTWNDSIRERYAVPHDANGNALSITKNTKPNAADLVTTTVTDLSKFIIALMNGEGLKASEQHNMVQHHVKTKENRYVGLGGFIYDLGNGEYAFSHGGDDPGVHSIYFILPKTGDGLIIFTNSDNGPKHLYQELIESILSDNGRKIVEIEMR